MANASLVYGDRVLVERQELFLVFEHTKAVGETFGLRLKAALGGYLLSTCLLGTSFGESGRDVQNLLMNRRRLIGWSHG